MWLFVKSNLIILSKMIKLILRFTSCRGFGLFIKVFTHEFDVLIGHLGNGVTVGAVEVDEPDLWDYLGGLGLDGLQMTLAEPAVDGVIGIACGGDNPRYGECIGDVFEFLFEPRAEG